MNKGNLHKRIRDGIATVEFYHPLGNSFTMDLLQRLTEAIKILGSDDEVRVIVLQSEDEGAFCGGASFEELLKIENLDQGKVFFSGFANVINAMRKCQKIIVGRIHGKAVGGGVGLAAACDYCYATEKASVRLSELSIGIGPFVIAPAIERKMGLAAFTELTLTPTEWHTAYWAKRKGLFAKVFETTRELDTEIAHVAQKLSGYNPKSLTALKRILWEGTDHWDDLLAERAAVSGQLVLSESVKKALTKFKKG